MFRFKAPAALVALTAIAAFALPASALATNVTRWEIVQQNDPNPAANGAAPDAGVPTMLLNWYRTYKVSGVAYPVPEPLAYGHETFGVNLTWGTPPYGASYLPYTQWEFVRQPGRYVTPQIAAGDHVALYDTANQRYLAWACSGFFTACIGAPIVPAGINLYFSTTPQYQWQVAKGGDSGHPFYADLFNDAEKAYLIDHSQTFGVDLGWIHAPFETGPDYIPPTLPVSTQPVSLPKPPPAK